MNRRQFLQGLGAAAASAAMPAPSSTQQVQAHLLQLRQDGLKNARPYVPLQRLDVPPAESHPFVFASTPYPFLPAAGAPAITILTYTVPQGFNAVINFLAIFYNAGGIVNGSGNIIWRVLLNDTGYKGMNNLQSQYGTDAMPLPTYISLVENDTIKVTVEVAAGVVVPPGATTGARFHGYEYAATKSLGGM
ncbi:MAG TPA: twin-arginine translocation signal domain-containing protein [Candidatus Angelobacter sp.]|jgi:hypothetical protein|nr:twin-arginine translocation signal domain-containing protein [Candidatus Angelobacter sp.]